MKLVDLLSYAGIHPSTTEPLWTTRLTLTLYALTCLLALWQMRQGAKPRRFYGMLALLLFGLGLARYLRWLEALTMEARMFAIVEGWYTGRHAYQRQLVKLGIASGVVGLLTMLWHRRRHLLQSGLVLVGVVYQLTFLLVQAISFHNLDGWLQFQWQGLRYATLLEWGGLVVIGVGLLLPDWTGIRSQLARVS